MDAGISYNFSFAEWEAGTAAGLDMWRWEMGGYPKPFRARVMAWHRLHKLVTTHVEAAVSEKAKKRK